MTDRKSKLGIALTCLAFASICTSCVGRKATSHFDAALNNYLNLYNTPSGIEAAKEGSTINGLEPPTPQLNQYSLKECWRAMKRKKGFLNYIKQVNEKINALSNEPSKFYVQCSTESGLHFAGHILSDQNIEFLYLSYLNSNDEKPIKVFDPALKVQHQALEVRGLDEFVFHAHATITIVFQVQGEVSILGATNEIQNLIYSIDVFN